MILDTQAFLILLIDAFYQTLCWVNIVTLENIKLHTWTSAAYKHIFYLILSVKLVQ